MANPISIKGTREGLTITLGDGELGDLMGDLTNHLKTQGAFFRGGRVALRTGRRSMSAEQLDGIQNILAEYDMILRTLVTDDPTTRSSAETLGLRLLQPETETTAAPDPAPKPTVAIPSSSATQPLAGSKGVLVRHVIRSGQVVRHTGHIVVVGDVNPGATVSAGGDIVIWGRLLGIAHAGAMGDEHAVVCALQMSPMQLRIGGLIARPQEDEATQMLGPEVAYVREGAIVVETWHKIPRGV